jgi:hypothetical protein
VGRQQLLVGWIRCVVTLDVCWVVRGEVALLAAVELYC